MQRREFSQAGAAALALGFLGGQRLVLAAPGAGPGAGAPAPAPPRPAIGTNLSGMEWANPGLRHGLSSAPNIHFSVPRKADIAYLAACGFTKNRLPIQWELLQPMLPGTVADARAVALIGEPGQFHQGYEDFITGVLDAHAAVGTTCILDLHNYGRYHDFVYQRGGAVFGLKAAPDGRLRPFTTDRQQLRQRIFALAEGATLTPALFADFWRRAAARWKGHPGLGGYGLMNEPHDLPNPGKTVESTDGREDLMILPVFMQAAIDAIRALDKATPIYVAGNAWSSAGAAATRNPGYPLAGSGLIYEVHAYLDRRSNGFAFDWDTETSRKPIGNWRPMPVSTGTGRERVKGAIDWAKDKKIKLALGEIGMPIDDPRWAESFKGAVDAMLQNGFEVYSWMGGNHWPIRNFPMNHAPGWHQGKTLEPLVSGVMRASAGIAGATLFDDGPGHAPAGTPLTITVYARGHLPRPLHVLVSVKGAGKLDKARLTIPAGPNGQDSFSYVPAANEVASLRYALEGQPSGQVPPPRAVYSLEDPVAHAAGRLEEGALAILAKYQACKWDMADGHTDYVLGAPAANGQPVRAVSDSGWGSSPGNAMEMLNWLNLDSAAMGEMALPLMRQSKGRKSVRYGGPGSAGLWCKKSVPEAGVQERPVNRVPYNLEDAHFTLAALSLDSAAASGPVFQASKAEAGHVSELGLAGGYPQARWVDARGQKVALTAPERLAAGAPCVLSLTSAPGAQRLRVNGAEAGRAEATLSPSACSQMLIGWGFVDYYPQDGFAGHVHAVVTGKGAPTAAELAVLEAYLARLAGVKA